MFFLSENVPFSPAQRVCACDYVYMYAITATIAKLNK